MTEIENTKKRTLGGASQVDAYCLIDGFLVRDDDKDDTNNNDYQRVTVPVTRLPAVFGRDHDVKEDDNINFFGIGTLKQFSRQHFRIDYWCNNSNGRLGQFQKSSELFQWDEEDNNNNRRPDDSSSELMNPENINLSKPFFTVTCLGKNGLFVQGKKVEKDKSIVVQDKTAVKASSFCFYFLQPSNLSYQTVSIPPSSRQKQSRAIDRDNDSIDSPPCKKKRGFSGLQAELDLLSTEDLLKQLNTAIETNTWERKHQFVGSTISTRAVAAAAQAPDLHALAAKSGGSLERSEVMDWIAASEQFSKWSQQMLLKLEAKSYQASITNAMVKGGYTRTAEKGRYIKWILPKLDKKTVVIKKEPGAEADSPDTPTKTVSSNDSLPDLPSTEEKHANEALGDSNEKETGEKQTDNEDGNSSGEEENHNAEQSVDGDSSERPEAGQNE